MGRESNPFGVCIIHRRIVVERIPKPRDTALYSAFTSFHSTRWTQLMPTTVRQLPLRGWRANLLSEYDVSARVFGESGATRHAPRKSRITKGLLRRWPLSAELYLWLRKGIVYGYEQAVQCALRWLGVTVAWEANKRIVDSIFDKADSVSARSFVFW